MKKLKALGLVFATLIATMMFTVIASAGITGVVQAEGRANSIEVKYNTVLGQDYYALQLSEDGINWVTVDGTYHSDSMNVSGLTAGRTYYARVGTATNSYGDNGGNWSEAIQVTTAPEWPDNSKVIQTGATTNSMTFTWTKVPGANRYRIVMNSKNVGYAYSNTYTFKNVTKAVMDTISVYPERVSNTKFAAYGTYEYENCYTSSMRVIPKAMSKLINDGYYPASKAVDFKWTQLSDVDGYQIEYCYYNGKGKKYVEKSSFSSWTDLTVKKNYFYKARVRAYVEVNNKKLYGAWSPYTTFCQDVSYSMKSDGVRNYSTGYKYVNLKWTKVKGAKRYKVYMSKTSNTGYKKIATTKKNKLFVNKFKGAGLKNSQTYYFYVIAERKVGKKTYKSGKKYNISVW